MGLGTFIIGMTTAFTTGCITWGKWPPVVINKNGNFSFNGGIIVYITGTILWFTQEIGRNAFFYPLIVYGLGFIVMITGIIFANKLFKTSKRFWMFPAIWLCAFSGLIGGATVGNFFSLVLFRQPIEVWSVLTIATPVERAIFAAGTMFAGVPLLIGLNKIGIKVGPQQDDT
jgi:hypothetical protein